MWRDFIYCSRQFINYQDQGEWMGSVRGTWGYKTTGKSCWCFSKYPELQRATEQFQGIISHGDHSLIVWAQSENNSLNGTVSGTSLNPRSAFPLISVCSGSGPPEQPLELCEPRFSTRNLTSPGCSRARAGSSLGSCLRWNMKFPLASALCIWILCGPALPFQTWEESARRDGMSGRETLECWGLAFHGRRGAGSCPLLLQASPSKCQLPAPSGPYLYSFKEMTAPSCCFAGGNSAGHILG